MSEIKTGVYVDYITNEEVSFKFKTSLDIKDKIHFVSTVCDVVASEHYYSFLKDLIFNFEIIEMFTDVDVSNIITSKDFIGDVEKIVNNTKIVDIVISNVNKNVIDELMVSVDNDIEYKTGVHCNSVVNNCVELIKTIKNKVESIDTDNIIKLANQLSPIINNLTSDNIVESYANSPAFLEAIKDREKRIQSIVNSENEKR